MSLGNPGASVRTCLPGRPLRMGIIGANSENQVVMFQQMMPKVIANPTRNRRFFSRPDSLPDSPDAPVSSRRAVAMGNASFSCSIHCFRNRTPTERFIVRMAARSIPHQKAGVSQAAHGTDCPGGRPS